MSSFVIARIQSQNCERESIRWFCCENEVSIFWYRDGKLEQIFTMQHEKDISILHSKRKKNLSDVVNRQESQSHQELP